MVITTARSAAGSSSSNRNYHYHHHHHFLSGSPQVVKQKSALVVKEPIANIQSVVIRVHLQPANNKNHDHNKAHKKDTM
jgi:hypothetical protein